MQLGVDTEWRNQPISQLTQSTEELTNTDACARILRPVVGWCYSSNWPAEYVFDRTRVQIDARSRDVEASEETAAADGLTVSNQSGRTDSQMRWQHRSQRTAECTASIVANGLVTRRRRRALSWLWLGSVRSEREQIVRLSNSDERRLFVWASLIATVAPRHGVRPQCQSVSRPIPRMTSHLHAFSSDLKSERARGQPDQRRHITDTPSEHTLAHIGPHTLTTHPHRWSIISHWTAYI